MDDWIKSIHPSHRIGSSSSLGNGTCKLCGLTFGFMTDLGELANECPASETERQAYDQNKQAAKAT